MDTLTFESLWAQYQPIVDSLSYQYANRRDSFGADHEDFRHEGVCWMLDNEKRLAKKYEELEDPERFGRWLWSCIENEFKDYLLDIRESAGGQPRKEAYWYTLSEIKALLPLALDPEQWLNPPQTDGGGRSTGIPAEGGNWIATLADISRAFSQLSSEDRELLTDFHVGGLMNKTMADLHEVTDSAMSHRHSQTLRRLLENLGGPKPSNMRKDVPYDPWRGRHAVSNTQARAMTSSQYEE